MPGRAPEITGGSCAVLHTVGPAENQMAVDCPQTNPGPHQGKHPLLGQGLSRAPVVVRVSTAVIKYHEQEQPEEESVSS